ncbi:MAG: hypothetical protein GX131_14740 [candidate division WS1 bacterium]|nr:hypothetical protein [candidate division WS1 bacterium]
MRVRPGILIFATLCCLLQPNLRKLHALDTAPAPAQLSQATDSGASVMLAQIMTPTEQQPPVAGQIGQVGPVMPNIADTGLSPLAPGDVVSIEVRDEPTVTGVYYVRGEGDVLLPMIGSVRAVGLTASQLGEQIASKLRQYVVNPHVTVLQLSGSSRVVSILGAVYRPGTYDLRSYPTTLALIGAAGGTSTEADLTRMVLVRNGESAPLTRPMDSGELIIPMDVKLEPGDAIIVPSLRQRSVRIVGAVAQPGLASLEDALTASRAVIAAGGPTELADLSGIQILRGSEVIQVNLRPLLRPDARRPEIVEDVVLQLDDVVMVPQAATRAVLVTGAVTTPGSFDATAVGSASAAIVAAGGVGENGDLSRAYVLRGGERIALDLTPLLRPDEAPPGAEGVDTAVRSGDILIVPERAPIFVIGAVNTPGTVPTARADTLSQAVIMAGGLAPDADPTDSFVLRQGRQIRVDLRALLLEGDAEADMTLQPQDAIVVPRRAQVVHVVGQVLRPGPIPVDSAKTIADAWAVVGGATPLADTTKIMLLRDGESTKIDMDAILKEGNTADNVVLRAGDTFIVPRIEDEAYVLGAVANPGTYPIREGDTIIEVIAMAGGPSAAADVEEIAIVRRSEVMDMRAQGIRGSMLRERIERPAPVVARDTTQGESVAPSGRPARRSRPLDPGYYHRPTTRVERAATPEAEKPTVERIWEGDRGIHLLELAEVQPGHPAYLVHAGDVIYVAPREMPEGVWRDVIRELLIAVTLGVLF